MKHDLEYYISERFIHDDVVEEARGGLKAIFDAWAQEGKVDPFALVWPSKPVSFHGIVTEGVLPFDMPKDRATWPQLLRRIIEKTEAYALLLTEQRAQDVSIIVESTHGSKSWSYPIRNHGDVYILEEPVEKTDTDCIGLLWSPRRGRC